jgi:predicted AAA+ superfamily ATPase
MEVEILERFNEWWTTKRVRDELVKLKTRYAFPQLIEQAEKRQITLLTGLRRVGKTTLFYQLIDNLLKKFEAKNIFYFSFDEERYSLKEVLETYEKKILKKNFENCGKIWIFLDEVQKAKDWFSTSKIFYDLYPNLKFFLSGSASLLLSKKAIEYLAGRFFEIRLKPLTFKEFLEMKGVEIKKIKKEDLELYQRKALPLFLDYLRKAGFPEIIDWEKDEEIKDYVKNSVIARVILRDIPIEFGVKDFELMEDLLKIIFSNPGIIFNLNSIAKSLGKSRITISNYIDYLKYSLTIRILSNYRGDMLISSRKFKKVYPVVSSLTFSYSSAFYEKEFFGKVLEVYAVNTLNANFYFRKNQKEVDMILERDKKLLPVEVKENVESEDIKKLAKVLEDLKLKEGVIVSLEQFDEKKVGDKTIKVLPAWCLEFVFD